MNYIKAILALCVILIIIFVFYTSFLFKKEYKLDRAGEEFIKQDLISSENILHALKNKISDTEYHLYLAYIFREKGSLENSNQSLKLAEEALINLKQPNKEANRLSLEVYLNQVYNAFIQCDFDKMDEPIKKAAHIRNDNIWVNFFKTLQAFLQNNYSLVLEEWHEQFHTGYLSPWMRKTFGDQFDSIWYSIHLCKAKIALGDYFKARKELLGILNNASDEQQNTINFLIALSYLKEAEEHSPLSPNSSYKEAIYYLCQVPLHMKGYQDDFIKVQTLLQAHTLSLIHNNHFEDIPFFTHVMKKWNTAQHLETLEHHLTLALNQKIMEKEGYTIKKIAQALNDIVNKEDMREQLHQKFLELFKYFLAEDNFLEIDNYLEAIRFFSKNIKQLNRDIATLIAAHIFHLIPIDSSNLALTTPYFEFWMKLDNRRSDRYIFAKELLCIAEKFWTQEANYEKAVSLFNLASTLPYVKDEANFYQLLTNTLTPLNQKATLENNFLQLSLLNAIHAFHVGENTKDPFSENYKHTKMAKERELDVIKNDPYNQKSLMTLGLIEFFEGNYGKTLQYLNEVKNLSLAAVKALAISNMLAGNYETGLQDFKNVSSQICAHNDDYKRLGFGFLYKKMPTESLNWFSKITPTPPDVKAGKSIAYFLSHQWKKAIEEFENLPTNYKMLPGLHRILLESTAALGDFQTCSQILKKILEKPKLSLNTTYSPIFIDFKTQYLDCQVPEFVAGMFYHTWKKDTPKALEYFRNLPGHDEFTSLNIGKILCEIQKYQEAYDVMIKAFPIDESKKISEKYGEEALPLLADIEEKLGYFYEASVRYARYYQIFPKQLKYRHTFAKILMNLHCYHMALKQWSFISKYRPLLIEEKILFVKCLVHLERFNAANKMLSSYLAVDASMPLEYQLEFAKLLFILNNKILLNEILAKVPHDFTQRSMKINQALLGLWIEMGEYRPAENLMRSILPQLEQTTEGLLLIASLHTRMSNYSIALNYATKAEKLEPYNIPIAHLIELNEIDELDLDSLKKQLAIIQKISQKNPSVITLKVEIVKKLLSIAAKKKKIHYKKSKNSLSELQEAHKILIPLIDKHTEIPVLYFLLGIIHNFNNEWHKARESFEKALTFDGSDIKALKFLSLIYMNLNNDNEAFTTLKKAIKFAPSDPEIWIQLAELHLKEKDFFSALCALIKANKFQSYDKSTYFKQAYIQLVLENPDFYPQNYQIKY